MMFNTTIIVIFRATVSANDRTSSLYPQRIFRCALLVVLALYFPREGLAASYIKEHAAYIKTSSSTTHVGSGKKMEPDNPDKPVHKESDAQGSDLYGNYRSESSMLLPDLRTLPPSDLEIKVLQNGVKQLRLTNMIWNSGRGPLELAGDFIPSTRQIRVFQRIYSTAGEKSIHLVGEFIWHPTHEHWHFEDFTVYELWSLTSNGSLDNLISSSEKLSYCVIDTDAVDQHNTAFSPRRRYGGCGQKLQGLSPGWGDTYKSHLDGQSVDISTVVDGVYALRSQTNPTGMVIESDPNNNSALVYIEIRGKGLRVIEPEELGEIFCQLNGRC